MMDLPVVRLQPESRRSGVAIDSCRASYNPPGSVCQPTPAGCVLPGSQSLS